MAYEFRPPTVPRRWQSYGRRDFLWDRVSLDVGVTVVKTTSGAYRQENVHNTNADDIAVVYEGGHTIVVDDAEADRLTSAGYGSYLTAVTP